MRKENEYLCGTSTVDMMYWTFLHSPIGLLSLNATDKGLRSIELKDHSENLDANPNSHLILAKIQLTEYFQRQRRYFELELDLDGYSDFQRSVWE
ncbi:MAG: hypothetical protein HKN67_10420, partial [Saprospiraceae bacterium]|nr:hypothetical protein [Saprospiraceae bacterium]